MIDELAPVLQFGGDCILDTKTETKAEERLQGNVFRLPRWMGCGGRLRLVAQQMEWLGLTLLGH